MASSYSPILRLTLPATGDLTNVWGGTVNTEITAFIEDAIAGTATIPMADANYTMSANNGSSDESRKAIIKATGALTAGRNLVLPASASAVSKLYIVQNATTGGFDVTFKTFAGTGIAVPMGATYALRCDGTNIVNMFNPNVGNASGTLGIANGGTGAITAPLARTALGITPANIGAVTLTSATGSAVIAAGTTAQQDGSPAQGYFRFNKDTLACEVYNGTAWGAVGGGATGGGTDLAFVENDVFIATDYLLGQAAINTACTFSNGSANITCTSSLVVGQQVQFSTTGGLPTNFSTQTGYYVLTNSGTVLTVSATSGGAAIVAGSAGTGTHKVGKLKNAESAGPVTVNTGVTVTVPTGAVWTVV